MAQPDRKRNRRSPYVIARGERFAEVPKAEFFKALLDRLVVRSKANPKRAYVRDDLLMTVEHHTGRLLFEMKDPAPPDRYAIPSWWEKLVGRHAFYYTERVA